MRSFFTFLLLTISCNAQYVAVTFGTAPTPTNLWTECAYQSTTNTRPPQVLFTVSDFNAYMAANTASFMSWKTNPANPQVRLDANLARIVALFQQIPAARVQMQTISTNTGMTQAQAIAAVRQEANVIDGILEELQRLGPVLKQIYKPEEDE